MLSTSFQITCSCTRMQTIQRQLQICDVKRAHLPISLANLQLPNDQFIFSLFVFYSKAIHIRGWRSNKVSQIILTLWCLSPMGVLGYICKIIFSVLEAIPILWLSLLGIIFNIIWTIDRSVKKDALSFNCTYDANVVKLFDIASRLSSS